MNTEPKLCYSSDEECFDHDTVHDAAEDLWLSGAVEVGGTGTVWEGEQCAYYASEFLPNIAECMQENAYSAAGEYSDGWEFTREQKKSLQELVAETVDLWAKTNNMQPTFYTIRNPRPIKVRIINDDGDSEVISTEQQQCTP